MTSAGYKTEYKFFKVHPIALLWRRNGRAIKMIDFNTVRCRMMTSSNGNIFRVTGPLCGEFTGPGEFPSQRPVMRSFDVFFDLHLNKRLSKESRGWRCETPSRPLWRHCNGYNEVNLFPNAHKRHPRARPWVRDMGCLLWVYCLINSLTLSLQCCM